MSSVPPLPTVCGVPLTICILATSHSGCDADKQATWVLVGTEASPPPVPPYTSAGLDLRLPVRKTYRKWPADMEDATATTLVQFIVWPSVLRISGISGAMIQL
ncbi:unnamed protein product [Pleuronectes platessa]|uniref:Uncharacterized protein n=1 Tax=Pleuronectes platessa TaxID=8262 RepID=A0A9N7Y4V9_PLEPL|nr:unnamed protein product [Pleuronectes platessa]